MFPVSSSEREKDGDVGEEEEEDGQDSSSQGSRPVDVVVDVGRVQPQGSHAIVPGLPGDVVGVRHVDVDQLQLEEPRDVQGD